MWQYLQEYYRLVNARPTGGYPPVMCLGEQRLLIVATITLAAAVFAIFLFRQPMPVHRPQQRPWEGAADR